MLGLAARLRRPYPILVDQIFGTRDAGAIEEAVEALPVEATRCFQLEVSVGALLGLELADGRRIALKVHQPTQGRAELEAQQTAQSHLASRGFPCPRPALGPTPFLDRLATADEWRTDGRRYADVTPARRRAMAAALHELTELGGELGPLPSLEAHQRRQGLWPRPHNALFDFDATKAGAEWIDDIAARAAPRMRAGPIVLAHQDWSVKHFRFGAGGRITMIYDWDSLSIDYESIGVGSAAATHTAAIHARPWQPSVDDTLLFVDDYERVRAPLGRELRAAVLACAVYLTAYTARCEHALAVSRGGRLVTRARAVLPHFAAKLLA